MPKRKTEQQAREEILWLVSGYCDTFYHQNKAFVPDRRIPYVYLMYDYREMVNLVVGSALEFWLTSGRYAEEFEKSLPSTFRVLFLGQLRLLC